MVRFGTRASGGLIWRGCGQHSLHWRVRQLKGSFCEGPGVDVLALSSLDMVGDPFFVTAFSLFLLLE